MDGQSDGRHASRGNKNGEIRNGEIRHIFRTEKISDQITRMSLCISVLCMRYWPMTAEVTWCGRTGRCAAVATAAAAAAADDDDDDDEDKLVFYWKWAKHHTAAHVGFNTKTPKNERRFIKIWRAEKERRHRSKLGKCERAYRVKIWTHLLQQQQQHFTALEVAGANGTTTNHETKTLFVPKATRLLISRLAKGIDKKAQLSLTNPRDACEKFPRFT